MAQQETEPKSPMWLPALGAGLFVLAAVAWVVSPPFTRADVSPDAGIAPASTADAGPSDAPPG